MKSAIKLTSEFGQKVFVHGRGWVKPDEFQEPVKEPELTRLMELEKKVTVNFIEAAEALREIKEKKLYLKVAETWEQYCKERLGRGIEAVRLQLKSLEIVKKSHTVGEPPLPLNDLRKLARIPAKPTSCKTTPDSEASLRRVMPETPAHTGPEEEDLCDENVTRIRRAQNNLNFQKALKEWLDEWLDESGI